MGQSGFKQDITIVFGVERNCRGTITIMYKHMNDMVTCKTTLNEGILK